MIKVTLDFASQEELLAFFTKTGPVPTAAAKVEAPKPSAGKAASQANTPATTAVKTSPAPTPTTTTAATESPKPAAAATPAAQTASSEKAADSVDYPTLQKAVFALANANREAAGEVAATFGVKTFKELDASKWADALAAVTAKLESLQVA